MSSALQNESDWIPDNPAELPAALEHLRVQLFAAGRSGAEVNGLTGWLFAKAIGERDTTAKATRARYRRILREVAQTAPTGSDPVRMSAATRRLQAAHNNGSGVRSVALAGASLAAA